MSEKKSLGLENHEAAALLHGYVERKCEPGVARGILKVHALIDAHYAAGNAGMYLKTILPLIREHIDGPVEKWMAKLGVEPVSYAGLLEERGAYCGAFFERMAESFAEADPVAYSFSYPDLNHTTDSLIELCSYCLSHRSNSTQVLRVEPDEHNESIFVVHPARSKKSAGTPRRKEQLGIKVEIDFTTMGDELPYCQLCTNLTMHTRELMRLLFSRSADEQISEEDRKRLSTSELRIVIPNFSRHYCGQHSPDDEPPTGYNRARGRRKVYYSMRRFMILARHACNLSVPYWHIVRAAAYLIPDGCPDQTLIDRVPSLVEEWYATWERPNERIPADDKVADLFGQIAHSFCEASHPLAEFATALAFQNSGRVYDAAKACDALPDEIERLIDTGFLHCSMIQALNLGGTFIVSEGG